MIEENNIYSTKILFSVPLEIDGELLGSIIMQVQMDSLNKYVSDYTGLGMTGEVFLALPYSDEEILLFTPL